MADGSVRIDVDVNDGDAKKKLEEIEDAAKDGAGGIDELGDSADEAGGGLSILDVAAGNLAASGLQAMIGALGNAVQNLFALAEETREFREDMAKLDTAFTTAGHTTEAASGAYTDFYAILGESDRSVEAVNHLAELTNNEQELAQWSTIAAGVTAKFGDSLPIEGLTEAANETAKVGQTTGVLADALNWASADSSVFASALGGNDKAMKAFNAAIKEGLPVEDAFTAALQQMGSEQERSTAITSTLNGLYSEAAGEYNELTASTQEARRAQAEMEQTQADLGATVEPLTTAWTNLKSQALEAITPIISTLAGKFSELMTWLQANPAVLSVLTGMLIALGAAMAVVTAAVIAQTVAQWAQNAAWLANPITWIVIAIVAAVGALVGAFLYLWNNCEGFRNFFIGMWEGIKLAWSSFIEWCSPAIEQIKEWFNSLKEKLSEIWTNITTALEPVKEALFGAFQTAWAKIQEIWTQAKPYFLAAWEGIKAIFAVVKDVLGGFFESAWNVIKNVWSVAVSYFQLVWTGITSVFSVVVTFFQGAFSTAWAAIQAVWDIVTGYFSAIWETIKGIFSVVKDVLTGNWSDAWEGIKGIVSTWTSYFSGVWESIKGVFSAVGSWFSSTFSAAVEAVKSVWNGITSFFSNIWTSIKNIFNDAKTKFLQIGKNIVDGLKQGISNAWESLKSWFMGKLQGLWEGAKSVFGIKSPSKKFAWVGDMIIAGLIKGLHRGEKKLLEAVGGAGQEMISSTLKLEDTMLAKMAEKDKAKIKMLEENIKKLQDKRDDGNEEAIDAEIETLQKEKDVYSERVKLLEGFSKEAEKHIDKYTALFEDYAKEAEKIADNLTKDVRSVIDGFNNDFDSQYSSILNSFDIFSFAEKGQGGKGETLIDMMGSQVDMLKEYNTALDTLSARGINQEFVDELKGMGVDILPQLEAINNMTDEELTEYVGLWEEKNALAFDATSSIMESQAATVIEEINNLKNGADVELGRLQATLINDMLALTGEIAEGMKNSSDAGLIELGNQIDSYVKIGSELMAGIAEGIDNGKGLVVDSFVSGIREAIAAGKDAADIHSPSKVAEKEIGANLALGVGSGWKNKIDEVKQAFTSGMNSIMDTMRAAVFAENARFATSAMPIDTSISDLVQAVGHQTAGINTLAFNNRGSTNTRPIVIEVEGRELGRTVVDVGGTEEKRIGSKISVGGAR